MGFGCLAWCLVLLPVCLWRPVSTAWFVINLFKKMTFEHQQRQWFLWCGGWQLKLENHPLQTLQCFLLWPFCVLLSKASSQSQPAAEGSAAKWNYKAFGEPDWLGKVPGLKEKWSTQGGDQGTGTWQGPGSWAEERRGRGGWDRSSRKEAEVGDSEWRGADAGAGCGGRGIRTVPQDLFLAFLKHWFVTHKNQKQQRVQREASPS